MSRAEFYRLVSGALRRTRERTPDAEHRRVVDIVVLELADTFSAHNTKFDATRFLKDCGIE